MLSLRKFPLLTFLIHSAHASDRLRGLRRHLAPGEEKKADRPISAEEINASLDGEEESKAAEMGAGDKSVDSTSTESATAAAAAEATAREPETEYLSVAHKFQHSFETYADRPCLGWRDPGKKKLKWNTYGQIGTAARTLGFAMWQILVPEIDLKPFENTEWEKTKKLASPHPIQKYLAEPPAPVVAIIRKRDSWWYM